VDKRILKQIKEFEKGDYIKVTWFDANDDCGSLEDHKKPEILVEEWGVYLSVEGCPKYIILGKHYIPKDHVWEATRIPLMLVQSVELIAKHTSKAVFLRRYRVEPCRGNVVKVKDLG
jgi:hypothetical protein